MRTVFTAVLATAAVFLGSCATSGGGGPLHAYLSQYKYEPFNPPRSRDGVGTIIDFKNGSESVVASPDPPESQCLTAAAVPRGGDIDLATLTQDYTITRTSALDANIAKGYIRNVDISGAYNDKRVKTVHVQLISPYEARLTRAAVAGYLGSVSQADPCRKFMADPKNYVIESVLGAKGIRYTFLGSGNEKVNIDTTLLKAIGLTGSTGTEFTGTSAIEWNSPVLIGYRLWKVTEAPGIAGAPLIIQEVTSSDLARAKSGR